VTTNSEGTVTAFDAVVGLGVVDLDGDSVPFHCIAIADGSRDISVGTTVSVVTARRFGRREAVKVTPRPS